MRMLLSGFPYEQIEYGLDFFEKNPESAEKFGYALEERGLKFLESLRFEAFKNSEEFLQIMKEQFPQILREHAKKGRRRFPSQSISQL